jgi:hypothetical protein
VPCLAGGGGAHRSPESSSSGFGLVVGGRRKTLSCFPFSFVEI